MISATSKPPFQVFFDQHRVAVLGVLRGILGSNDAEDCAQEAFVAALRAYPDFDGANPRPWVLKIARNKALDQIRARDRRPGVVGGTELVEAIGVTEPPRPDLEDRFDAALPSALARLGEGVQSAILLRVIGELRYAEVAAELEISEAAARRRVCDGLAALRLQLDPEEVVA